MIKYNIKRGRARLLALNEEIILTKIIGQIIIENDLRCIAFNICVDHVHMILVCKEGELTQTIQKIKSISSKLFHRHPEIDSKLTSIHKNHLWSQKYFRASFNEWTLSTLSNSPGEIYNSSYLISAIKYIIRNREKHGLEDSNELRKVIDGFVISIEKAYGLFKGS